MSVEEGSSEVPAFNFHFQNFLLNVYKISDINIPDSEKLQEIYSECNKIEKLFNECNSTGSKKSSKFLARNASTQILPIKFRRTRSKSTLEKAQITESNLFEAFSKQKTEQEKNTNKKSKENSPTKIGTIIENNNNSSSNSNNNINIEEEIKVETREKVLSENSEIYQTKKARRKSYSKSRNCQKIPSNEPLNDFTVIKDQSEKSSSLLSMWRNKNKSASDIKKEFGDIDQPIVTPPSPPPVVAVEGDSFKKKKKDSLFTSIKRRKSKEIQDSLDKNNIIPDKQRSQTQKSRSNRKIESIKDIFSFFDNSHNNSNNNNNNSNNNVADNNNANDRGEEKIGDEKSTNVSFQLENDKKESNDLLIKKIQIVDDGVNNNEKICDKIDNEKLEDNSQIEKQQDDNIENNKENIDKKETKENNEIKEIKEDKENKENKEPPNNFSQQKEEKEEKEENIVDWFERKRLIHSNSGSSLKSPRATTSLTHDKPLTVTPQLRAMTITHTIPISFFDDEEHEHKRAFICRRNNRTPITKVKFNSLPTSDRSSFSEKIFLNSDSSNNININNNIVKEIVIKDTQKEEKNENISLDQLLDNLQSNYENSLQSNKNELNNNDNKENEVNKVDIKTSNDINNDNNDKNNDNNNDNNNGEGENRTTPASKLVFFKRDSKIDHVIVDDDKNVNDNSSNNNSNNSNNNSSNSNTSSDSIGRDLESSGIFFILLFFLSSN